MCRKTACVFKALGHPVRLKVVELLSDGDKCVCEIFPALRINQPNASQHLTILKSAGIVDSYRDGSKVYYHLTSSAFADLVSNCRRITGELMTTSNSQQATCKNA